MEQASPTSSRLQATSPARHTFSTSFLPILSLRLMLSQLLFPAMLSCSACVSPFYTFTFTVMAMCLVGLELFQRMRMSRFTTFTNEISESFFRLSSLFSFLGLLGLLIFSRSSQLVGLFVRTLPSTLRPLLSTSVLLTPSDQTAHVALRPSPRLSCLKACIIKMLALGM